MWFDVSSVLDFEECFFLFQFDGCDFFYDEYFDFFCVFDVFEYIEEDEVVLINV